MSNIILDEYRIGFVPTAVGAGKIFASRESRVFFLVVRNTHRVSSQFPKDCVEIGKAFRKKKPQDVKEFERLLLDTAKDPVAQSPWRPQKEKMRVIADAALSDELQAKNLEEQVKEYYLRLEELRRAMAGLREPEVKYKVEMRVEN